MLVDMYSNYKTIRLEEFRHPQVFPTILNVTQMMHSAVLTTSTSIANVGDLGSFPCRI